MEGREGMALQGSAPYYLHRGLASGAVGAVGSGAGQSGISSQQPTGSVGVGGGIGGGGYRPVGTNAAAASVVVTPQQQPIVRAGSSSVSPAAFNVEGSPGGNVPQGFTITVASPGGTGGGGSLSEPGKKKRGRPRKYGPDGAGAGGGGSAGNVSSGGGNVSLGLSPSSPNSLSASDKKKRGRPPGSGRKQRLASVGEWMNNSAGLAFTPHVIHVAPGEDIAAKILSFAQQRPRALCIMSGSGGVSAVTLRQPGAANTTVTFEGRFEILCLSGSYLVAETGGTRNRTGGVNVSLSSPDGQVLGGVIAGRLVAARPVQVVVCSFVYGNVKGKSTESASQDEKNLEQPVSDKTSTQMIASPSQNAAGSWPDSKGMVDVKNPSTDIDLASG